MAEKILINNAIKSRELRVIGPKGENLGVITKEAALAAAKQAGLDLIEVSGQSTPPVAKIIDYGKYVYELSKKAKDVKAKSHSTETKVVQTSIGISEHDILIKSKQAAQWLKEGHRVKVEMQVKGRSKYMDEAFLRERLNRMLAVIPAQYKIAEPPKKLPKGGFYTVLENSK